MGKRLAIGFLWGLLGYVIGAIGGGLLVFWLAPNLRDHFIESVMTGVFVAGPMLASVGFAIGYVRARPPVTAPASDPIRDRPPR
jgi:hypothetical protein